MAATKEKKAGKKDKGKKDAKATPEVGKREAARAAKAEAAAAEEKALIEAGDLIVKGDDKFLATPGSGKVADIVAKIVPALQKATKTPVTVTELAEKYDYKYPEDLAPAFYALESLGVIKRFALRTSGAGRATPAYMWVGE